MLHSGYRANRILNSAERPQATDDKICNSDTQEETKHKYSNSNPPVSFFFFSSEMIWALAVTIIIDTGNWTVQV